MSQSLIRFTQSSARQESVTEVLTATVAVLSTSLLYVAVALSL